MKKILNKIFLFKQQNNNPNKPINDKVIFLNNCLIILSILALAIGITRWKYDVMASAIGFFYTFVVVSFVSYLRYHQDRVELVSTILLVLYFIYLYLLYLLLSEEPIRLASFFVFTAVAYFLKGPRQGLVWGLTILFFITLSHFFPWFHTNYSNRDILVYALYMIALVFILFNYELQKADYITKLGYLNSHLENTIAARTKQLELANADLNKINKQKTSAYELLARIEYEERMMNKLSDMIQVCISLEEISPRVSKMAQVLFPEFSGGLAIYRKTTNNLETVCQWGNNQVLQMSFPPEDCFSIRSGSITVVNDPEQSVPCNHYTTPPKNSFISIPLFVQNELIGLFQFSSPQAKDIPKHVQELAIRFSNIVKITLANINLRQSLLDLSLHDTLTGLYNRRILTEYLPRELARIKREETTLLVAMLDLDDFKKINDTYGHDAGDEVLKFIGQALMENFRTSDIACRFGGEEFFVVMNNVDMRGGINKLNQLREKIQEKTIMFKGRHLPHITVSIGVAEAPGQGETIEALVEAADQALYVAKQSGKNKVVQYQSRV